MTQLKQFKTQMKKGNVKLKEVSSRWPYDYDANFKAYIATLNDISIYYCFSSEGKLLTKNRLTK